MRIAQREHEFAGLKPRNLRHHQSEQGVRRDVERNPQEEIGAALVELAREAPVGDVELEQRVAGR